MKFFHSVQSEWIKTKRSAAAWLCLFGGFFIPVIFLIVFFVKHFTINSYYPSFNPWTKHFYDLWQNMATFLLPMGMILAASLITQMEFKNNTWKQLHTTPQSYTTIFFAKFTVIVLMTLKFFVFLNIGMAISGILPTLIFEHRFPLMSFPLSVFWEVNAKVFLACLPILAIQYLISLKFKNFLVAIGVGFLGWVGSLIGLSWKYIFIDPYAYCTLLAEAPAKPIINLQLAAAIYFVLLMGVSYLVYIRKKEKG